MMSFLDKKEEFLPQLRRTVLSTSGEGRPDILKAWETFVEARFRPHTVSLAPHRRQEERVWDADLELTALEMMAVKARQHRNKATTACSLPPEILACIFSFVSSEWAPHGKATLGGAHAAKVRYSLGWMQLLHTCTSWRQVALGMPELWTHIRCLDLHPRSLPTLLARSRLLPLTIHADGNTTMPDGVANPSVSRGWLTPSVFRRTRKLVLENIPNALLQLWINELRHPMPQLEVLELTGYGTSDGLEPRPVLSSSLFGRTVPTNLKNLSLVDIGFSWSSHILATNLRSLKLQFTDSPLNDPIIANSMPNLQQFHQMLSSMSALETLELEDVFPMAAPIDAQTLVFPERFNSLTMYASNDSVTSCLDLLECMALPECAKVTVNLSTRDDLDERVPDLLSRLFGHRDDATPRELMMSRFSIGMQYVDHPQESIMKAPIPSSLGSWASYHMAAGGRGLSLEPVGASLPLSYQINSLPLKALHTITCAHDTHRSLQSALAWSNSFATAKNVENVSITFDAALHLFEALVETSDEGDFILFPNLTTIYLHAPKRPGYKTQTKIAELHLALEVALLDAVQLRREKGAPIKSVRHEYGVGSRDLWDRVKEFAEIDSFFPP
ncbi:unnamed protein product [Peniophora sp. CBMAI 1063]|nr:unnamed protein product [Peniophora sp. CBMAI 1063]